MRMMRWAVPWVLATLPVGCAHPSVPMTPTRGPSEPAAPRSELIVITDDGLVHPEGRTINQLGSVLFLNEASAGPVSVTIGGGFDFLGHFEPEHGERCVLVRAMEFTGDMAVAGGPIARGSIVSTCAVRPGEYPYVVRVGDKQFFGEFTVTVDSVLERLPEEGDRVR